MKSSEAQKEFIKAFGSLTGRRSAWDAWSDWLVMASSSIYNAIHRDPVVEEEYLQVAKRYERDELDTMAHLLAITVQALEAETHDFLGATFHALEVHNKDMGQFFTPFEVCRLMARILLPELPRPGRLLVVGEPTSGSGSMVLAFHEAMMERGAVQSRILYHLKDLDHRAWRMAYIQCSLLGVAAEVQRGNTLTLKIDLAWRTPGYYLHDMPTRLRVDSMMRAIHGDDHDKPTAEFPQNRTGVPTRDEFAVDASSDDQGGSGDGGGCADRKCDPTLDPLPEPESQESPPTALQMATPATVPPAPFLVAPDLILPRPGENFSLF